MNIHSLCNYKPKMYLVRQAIDIKNYPQCMKLAKNAKYLSYFGVF